MFDKHIFTLNLLLIIVIFTPQSHQFRTQNYYIGFATENSTCDVNGTLFHPCYMLHDLEDVLSAPSFTTYGTTVNLILLPGKHVLIENHTIAMSSFNEVNIRPWSTKESVDISCEVSAHFSFKKLTLRISFVHFNSCTLEYTSNSDSIHITNTVFRNEGLNYAIVTSTFSLLEIVACTFYTNNGAILSISESSSRDIVISDTLFMNIGHIYGNPLLEIFRNNLKLSDCRFIGNRAAQSGGAIWGVFTTVTIYDSIFRDNSARGNGGAISLQHSLMEISNSEFRNNSAEKSGGALYYYHDDKLQFDDPDAESFFGNSTFISNRAGVDGGAVYCEGTSTYENSVLLSFIEGYSESNSAEEKGGFASLTRCRITLDLYDLIHNSATSGGAIYAKESVIILKHLSNYNVTHVISDNTAVRSGGAFFLYKSYMIFKSVLPDPVTVLLRNNIVTSEDGQGGAIFVQDSNCDSRCFFNFDPISDDFGTKLIFSNNQASRGSVLYGGLLDRCSVSAELSASAIEIFMSISYFEQSPLAITSNPLKVCLCDNNSQPDCIQREINVSRMRGASVQVTLVALDQINNTVSSIIAASYEESLSTHLKQGERSREISGRCTNLKYHIFTENTTDESALILQPSESPSEQSLMSEIKIHIRILPCSRGFEQQENTCLCDSRLTKQFGISDTDCDIDEQVIWRRGSIWLRYDEEHLKIVSNCPFDYCQVTGSNISLISPDEQCAGNRAGVLCGACQGNYSVALGGSKCKDCTSTYNFIWLTFVIAVAGLALVALLLICNMTISTGTLSGLIFYANVVSISGLTSLHNCSIHPILSVFIAWVNLDLGVETCFYSGMDTYQKTWLQFAFPLYIWLLVTAIIVASYYSSTAMRLFGRNNVAILATLFILSYAKILKTIITALSFTPVWVGSANDLDDGLTPYKVWTYDGNIDYLKGKHVVLFVVAFLLLVLLFLPYTLLILFGQWVRSMSVKRCRWVLRLIRSTAFISIMDAYHAPYDKQHRYWTGLLLLMRCFLFLVFATNSSDNEALVSMFTTSILVTGILINKVCVKVYRKFWIELLEIGFLLNLGILSTTVCYLKGRDGSDANGDLCKTVAASVSISFVMFVGILVYHAYLQVKKSKYYVSIKRIFINRKSGGQQQTITADSKVMDSVNVSNKSPTATTVELREPLLEPTLSQ